MHQEQRQRAQAHLKAKGIERALFANPSTVKWLTGFAPPVQVGPNFFAGGPPLVWYEAGYVPGYRVCMAPIPGGGFDADSLRHRFHHRSGDDGAQQLLVRDDCCE